MLYALNIRVPEHPLPTDHITFPNPYQLGDIMPMGGHLTLERMQCNATARSKKDTYVRVVLNEAVIPYQDCQDGPGYSCSLANYTKMVHKNLANFTEECNVRKDVPQHLSFFWDYNTTTSRDRKEAQYIPYQGLTSV